MSSLTSTLASIWQTIPALTSIPVSRDEPAGKTTGPMPYIVVLEGISVTRDGGSGRDVLRLSELVQVDLFQNRDPAPEDHTLMLLLADSLDRAAPRSLGGVGGALLRFRPESTYRRFDRTTRVVTESLTVRVIRTT